MARRYHIVIEQDETGTFIATAPALPGVVEQGETADEAFANMGKAMRFTLDSMLEEGEELPASDASEVRDIELAI
jgi:predicted RNase H-like HicB family nuclease